MRYLKLYESFEDIHEICKEHGIIDYTINPDGSIDVDFVKRLGIDTNAFRIENVNTIEEFATLAAKLNETIKNNQAGYQQGNRFIRQVFAGNW